MWVLKVTFLFCFEMIFATILFVGPKYINDMMIDISISSECIKKIHINILDLVKRRQLTIAALKKILDVHITKDLELSSKVIQLVKTFSELSTPMQFLFLHLLSELLIGPKLI
ncbi:hypothetical protein HHI36_019857 [Cryptolaemus montrouzieri]|uniref:Uncharacterized protein n=1 Tax=Cryptolaemus montrouzieri TaxID=559131 RepID=A0ABD2N8L0_9CUCU